MGPPGRGEARRRHGSRLLLFALAGFGALQVPTPVLADQPVVEPAETASGFAWKPAVLTSAPGGTVTFRNPSTLVPHGLAWTGGPEKPSCSGVPVDSSGTGWSGNCAFAQAGTYTFVCTVHPEEMKGTVTVASGEPAPPPTPGPPPPASSETPAVKMLWLAHRQRGDVVRGAIAVSAAAAGGTLTVELRATRAALGRRGTGLIRVGRLTRSLSNKVRQPFAVALISSARHRLRVGDRLPMTVKIVVRPRDGQSETLKRRVELHA